MAPRESDLGGYSNGSIPRSQGLPNPPATAEELQAALSQYEDARNAIPPAEQQLREIYDTKDEKLEVLVDLMKADLKYAEITARHDPERLRQFGWGPRRSSRALAIPGQVLGLKVVGEGDGWLVLEWKEPVDGGEVAAYNVLRRQRGEGSWKHVDMTVKTQILLNDQERGVEFEYHVRAANKAGLGKESSVVTVVL